MERPFWIRGRGDGLFPGIVWIRDDGRRSRDGTAFADKRARMALAFGVVCFLSVVGPLPLYKALYAVFPVMAPCRRARFGQMVLFAVAILAGLDSPPSRGNSRSMGAADRRRADIRREPGTLRAPTITVAIRSSKASVRFSRLEPSDRDVIVIFPFYPPRTFHERPLHDRLDDVLEADVERYSGYMPVSYIAHAETSPLPDARSIAYMKLLASRACSSTVATCEAVVLAHCRRC